MLIFEGLTIEMRERMKISHYWQENRRRKDKVIYSIIIPKELIEISW